MSKLVLKNLTVEHVKKAVGIDCQMPRFGWVLDNETDKNVMQEAYQVVIFSDRTEIADTGKCFNDKSVEVTVPDFKAKAKTEYGVRVKVWDNAGNEAEAETVFETGFLDEKWETSWYEPEQIPTEPSLDFEKGNVNLEVRLAEGEERDFHEFQPAQFIRIPVYVKEKPVKARTYMTAHGVYAFFVNGVSPDDRTFAPDHTPYDKYLQYQTYDILPYLSRGKNILGTVIGDGWWCGRIGATGDSCQYGDSLGLLIQTELTYEDGRKEVITGESGVSSTGPIIFSDIFVGEKYDARKELTGWKEAAFDDSLWKPLKKADYDMDNLSGQYGNPVKPVRVLKPIRIIHTPAGETVLDLGQVLAGQMELCVVSEGGREIRLEYSEVLDKEGNFFNNVLGVNKEQTEIYITKEGSQTYRPSFTYHGFRYVKVTGWPGEPDKNDFTVYVLSSEMEEIGEFSTSDERLNQLQSNIVWSQIANTLSIPTDCPQRERAGWTGDIMAFGPTMCFNRESDAFLTRWMKSVRADQLPNGAVPDVVPYIKAYRSVNKAMSGFDTSCGWGDAVIRVPLAVYQAYGDRRILEENYDAMKRWIDYIDDRAKNHHPEEYGIWDAEHKARSRYLWNTDFHFGDWLVPSMVLGNPDGAAMLDTAYATMGIVAPAYYAFSARSMKEVAEILGKEEDTARYEELYQNIRKAFIEEYEDENGKMEPDIQGIYIIALKNDLVTDEVRPKMVGHLRDLIEKNNYCLDTGFLSVLFLMDVLCENGCRDLAYKLLFQTRCPSWLYEVEHGATTMWESWGAVLEDGTVSTYSYNHYAFGCVGEWLYREIGGLKAIEAGYKKIRVEPAFDTGLTKASVSEYTPYGQAKVSWEIIGENVELQVKVPVNTMAEVVLENKRIETIGSGTHQFVIGLA